MIEKTNLKFFCGINANCFSNTLKSDLKYTERLNEDPRSFSLNWHIRPIVRSLKNEAKPSAVILTKNRPYHWYFIFELQKFSHKIYNY